MLYEMRRYEMIPGKRPAMEERHATHTTRFFKKYGMGMVGFWTEEIGGNSNQITYILSFDSMADREAKWGPFLADPDRVRAGEYWDEREGPMVIRVQNTLMRLTPYSPEPKFTTDVQELRIYDSMPGKMPALHDRFANHTTPLFKKHGMEVIAYWTDEIGINNRLIYMLGYPSLGDREKSWTAFQADPDWRKARVQSEVDGSLVKRSQSTILRPTSYSPRS